MSSEAQTPAILRSDDGLLLGVRVSPSARRTRLGGLYGDRIKVALSSPPEDNRANTELVSSLADWLGLRKDGVRVQSGHASRDKVVVFTGIEETDLRVRLAKLLEPKGVTKGDERNGS